MKSTYNVEFAGNQIESKEVIAKAKKVWVDAGNKDRKIKDLKTMDLYLKPERTPYTTYSTKKNPEVFHYMNNTDL